MSRILDKIKSTVNGSQFPSISLNDNDYIDALIYVLENDALAVQVDNLNTVDVRAETNHVLEGVVLALKAIKWSMNNKNPFSE